MLDPHTSFDWLRDIGGAEFLGAEELADLQRFIERYHALLGVLPDSTLLEIAVTTAKRQPLDQRFKPERIATTLAHRFNLTLPQLLARGAANCIPKSLAIALCWCFSDLSLKEVAIHFGYPDHGIVIFYTRSLRKQLHDDDEVQRMVAEGLIELLKLEESGDG
ncbi:MAG: hypothetical protein E1N59_2982 [Puniceicoccaceae bacterium 5H]|nr:MAG: hypothetical protein E1N59_2982 [Puniceicoccaceae bacterium 5H]